MSSKVIVITGASSGIGAALAKRLAEDGHALVLAARGGDRLTAVQQACSGAVSVPTDVTKRSEVERLSNQAIAAFGRVDVWVNNAGRGINREVLDLTDDDLDEMLLINTKSALYGMQAIVPHFTARGSGHVINISSMLTKVPTASFRSAYGAAKAALNILTACLRMDLRARYPGVHVSLIVPGSVPGAFQQNAIGGTPATNPPGGAPPQTPEEVADVIAEVIDHPVPEAYTHPDFEAFTQRYAEDIEAFECSRIPTTS